VCVYSQRHYYWEYLVPAHTIIGNFSVIGYFYWEPKTTEKP